MKSLQATQNRMLRTINGTKIKDKISTSSLLEKYGLLSVNQLAAKIKLLEAWKIVNKDDYPLTLEPYNPQRKEQAHDLRTKYNRVFKDTSRLIKAESSFHLDSARIWNAAPPEVRNSTSLFTAKKSIEAFCKSLPI